MVDYLEILMHIVVKATGQLISAVEEESYRNLCSATAVFQVRHGIFQVRLPISLALFQWSFNPANPCPPGWRSGTLQGGPCDVWELNVGGGFNRWKLMALMVLTSLQGGRFVIRYKCGGEMGPL